MDETAPDPKKPTTAVHTANPMAHRHHRFLLRSRLRRIPLKPFRPVARMAIPLWKGGPQQSGGG
jgi:hypothetical protein